MPKLDKRSLSSFGIMTVMIRTRDFVLFVVVIFFLAMSITVTVLRGGVSDGAHSDMSLQKGAEVSEAHTDTQEIDRQSIIDRLREKIRSTDLVIVPQASVTSDASVLEQETTDITVASTLLRCAAADDTLAQVPKWPLNQVQFAVEGARRNVFTTQEVVVTVPAVATGTPATESTQTIQNVLLSLPALPQKQAAVACVPSEVIGVSTRGVLMFNRDIRAYRNTSENTLIGYARDGFPIYGVYDGAVDACGGYEHAAGYRYTVSAERDYIIGCFMGTPQPLNIE